jgi:hypothetical protein
MCCLFAQVAARLAAESGSICSVGLLPPAAAVKAEIAAFLAARQAGQPSSRATCTTATPAAASAAAPGVAGAPPNSRPPVAASTHSTHGQQLLPSGCPAVAASVYTSLLTWLQDQQQQNQQQQQQQLTVALMFLTVFRSGMLPAQTMRDVCMRGTGRLHTFLGHCRYVVPPCSSKHIACSHL